MKIFDRSKKVRDVFSDKDEKKEGDKGSKKEGPEQDYPKPPLKLPEIEKLQRPPQPMQSGAPASRGTGSPEAPPLFIKVDRYDEIVKNIRDLKSSVLNLRDSLDVLEDIEKEIANGIGIAHRSIDELNSAITNLDSFFMRPQGVRHHMDEDLPARGSGGVGRPRVEDDMRDVYGQVEKLRAQLKAMR